MSSLLIPEQIPIARKQFESGRKIFFEIKFKACASESKSVFVEKAVTVFPEAATIMQNAGTKAKIKSAQTDIAAHAEEIEYLSCDTRRTAITSALTVESKEIISELFTLSRNP